VAQPRSAPLRIYADTSVFGGCFDDRFRKSSRRFFRLVRHEWIQLLTSEIVERELEAAPERVRRIVGYLPVRAIEKVPISEVVRVLQHAYLRAGVVGPSSDADAAHVAAATVARADAILSWNFKHIAGLAPIQGYNRVNVQRGYRTLTILTPLAMVLHAEE